MPLATVPAGARPADGRNAHPHAPPSEELEAKAARLRGIVRGYGSTLVAYSGGVDSTLVAKIARDELGDRALAVTIVSAFLAKEELALAEQFAREIGIRHELVREESSDSARAMENAPDRCYHCKFSEYGTMREIAARRVLAVVCDGTQRDDRAEVHRPGLRAAEEHGVRSPLADAGLSKADVRAISAALGLSSHDKPSAPCLASRFPYGERITLASLSRVERAEAALRDLGFRTLRVRAHGGASGELARIEVGAEEIGRFANIALRDAVRERVRGCGFEYVTMDLDGYRPSTPPSA